MAEALGIDFGTSTTVFVGCLDGKLRVLCDDNNEEIIPSFLAFTPTGNVQIGKAARNRTLIDPTNTLYSVKRVLGLPWHAPDVVSFRRQYPFALERGEDGLPRFITRAGKLTAAELTEIFLAHTREFASLRRASFSRVCVTVPERAETRQQEATVQAVQLAGFPTAETVSEPAAATLAYFYGDAVARKLLVYDFGGGTFDTAVLRWDGERAAVLSSAGDSYLGGDDIDSGCTQWAAEEILKTHRWDVRTNAKSLQVLRYLVEQAKVLLSVSEQMTLNLSPVDEVLKGATLIFTRAQLETFVKPLVLRSLKVCDSALDLLSLGKHELDGIVLSGGTTYMPLVQQLVAAHFDRPLLTKLPPDRVVAMGAALLARQRAERGRG